MEIQVNPEIEGIIAARVAHGMNADASDVMREAIYLLVERDQMWHAHPNGLDQEIQVAMDEIARGEGITEKQLLQHIAQRNSAFFSTK